MTQVIENAAQVTPEWLTANLSQQGILRQGQVMRVTPGEARASFASRVCRLKVTYSANASPGVPARLFLKTSSPALAPGEFDHEQIDREVYFYQVVAPAMNTEFIIPCFSAARDAETGATHILLKDITATHTPCSQPPSSCTCEQAVEILSRLHAFWWDHLRLGKDIGQYPTWEERQQDFADTEKCTHEFMNHLGDALSPAWGAVYESVLPALPNLFRRHAAGKNLTLVHGDAHLGNFLFPRNTEAGSACLLDWQFWHPTIGGTDLAFMIATEWEIAARRERERPVLRRYYEGLLERGVQGYAWDACWDDYRLSVILVSLFIPVWRWSVFHWDPDFAALERGMTAFNELKCADLL